MPNPLVAERLEALRTILVTAYTGGRGMSAATKGKERELFIDSFLNDVLPPPFRIGSGDVTDPAGTKTGQLDVVVEYPFLPSLPLLPKSPRLYFAESVAAVVEVKSNLESQWDDVLATATRVKALTRNFGATMSMGLRPQPQIPLLAVGYTGWATLDSIKKRVEPPGLVDAILVLDRGMFVSSSTFGGVTATGNLCLLGLLDAIRLATSSLKAANPSLLAYAR